MSTHGTIAIRRKQKSSDEVFVFHITHDGGDVEEFMTKHKSPASIEDLIFDAMKFTGDGRYDDCPNTNFYVEPHNSQGKYHNMTEYSVYFDGKKWHNNLQ